MCVPKLAPFISFFKEQVSTDEHRWVQVRILELHVTLSFHQRLCM